MSAPLATRMRELAVREPMSARARSRLTKLADQVEVMEIDNGVVTKTLGKMLREAIGLSNQATGES